MDNMEQIAVDFTSTSGKSYKGNFSIKSTVTRSDRFKADQIRRQLLGPSPEGTAPLPALQTEAFILGQLAVRIMKAPKWWDDSESGTELEDQDVIFHIYDKILEIDEKRNSEVKKEADKALKKLTKKIEEE